MNILSVKNILTLSPNRPCQVHGWIRTVRMYKQHAFAEICDGSSLQPLQAILPLELAKSLSTGSSVQLSGQLVKSPGIHQSVELQVDHCHVYGPIASNYPLSKTKLPIDYLRQFPHLRSRSKLFGSLWRMRDELYTGFHSFFKSQDFTQIQTPLITLNDCEGGGEVFQLQPAFFGKNAYLTVSGQLHLEAACAAIARVYTLNPAFRAEKSISSRHLAEFWMLEAEMAFMNDLTMLCHFVEATIQSTVQHLLTSSLKDLEFLNQFVDPHLIHRLESISKTRFESMTYDKAIDILKQTQKTWEHSVDWHSGLQTEHERFLAEQVVKGPVFITHYPKHQKPFYMKSNEERVECMDLLIPQVGELVGGSLRESCPKQLEISMKHHGLDIDAYQWYLDLRHYGTTPHGGFGLGIERMMQLVTGMKSVRDVILYPRWFEHCQG